MNPISAKEAFSLAKKIDAGIPKKKNIEVVIAPPFPYLECIKYQVSSIKLGAQDVFWEDKGAYTGEVSPTMLKNLGAEYVIVGHSERRRLLNETDEMVNKKVQASMKAGLKVILCVGEPKRATRDMRQGIKEAKSFVKRQLQRDLKGISKSHVANPMSLIVAYEPIWAISAGGAGKPDKPEDAAEMIRFIKQFLTTHYSLLATPVLYGGSVNSSNVRNFLQYEEVDGALVGSASLKHQEFKKIIAAVSSVAYY
ncbi:MAG: triose-phosphate isomerase [Candidatus Liptonbacteria bacterium]|nr:triose-phosphate isomerase [Candidatus Liptonbacteria bacterium]